MPSRIHRSANRSSQVLLTAFLPFLATPPEVTHGRVICTKSCGSVTGFMAHAFGGAITRNGGTCLDYQPEQTGTAVFLNDCAASHPIEVQEVADPV